MMTIYDFIKILLNILNGACRIDIIVDKLEFTNDQQLILIKRLKKIGSHDIVVAVLLLNLQNGQAQFAITNYCTYESN